MAHACFSCRKQAWASAQEETEPGESSVRLLQDPWGPWALPFYPKLGDPFRPGPEFPGPLRCCCGLSCGSCSGCGRLLEASCEPCPEGPGPRTTARTQMDPQAGKAGPAGDRSGTNRGTVALGTSQESEHCVSGDPPAPVPADPALGLPL